MNQSGIALTFNYVKAKKITSDQLVEIDLKNGFNLEKLPDDLKISTMTVTCNLDTLIDIQNVGKYISMSHGRIVCVKYGPNNSTVRTLIKLKKKKKKKEVSKHRQNFYNQATVIIDVEDNRRVNIKVFKNGAIQMTGCKSHANFMTSMKILCEELGKKKAIYDKAISKIVSKYFVDNFKCLSFKKIFNVKIRMINSNFDIGFLINRKALNNLINKQGIKATFEPCIHACVNIKYVYKKTNDEIDIVSVFVFESGSIIITGAKNREHIVEAYKFITSQLYENYDKIIKSNVNTFLERDDIQEIIKAATTQIVSTCTA
jgi:TATA-box binding protein (TBP) (component of TFIID and TFIIIB)